MQYCLLLSSLFFPFVSIAQDSSTITVHFLYGSKPTREYKHTEPKWFGGKLGGHAGIAIDSGQILNFLPTGKRHFFAHKKPRSRFAIHSEEGFYSILGGDPLTVKRTTIQIPVSTTQKALLDSLSVAYQQNSPYDYALFGMRCGAATYDVLSQAGLLPHHPTAITWRRIFYPKLVRKKLLKMAATYHWTVSTLPGTTSRKWEND